MYRRLVRTLLEVLESLGVSHICVRVVETTGKCAVIFLNIQERGLRASLWVFEKFRCTVASSALSRLKCVLFNEDGFWYLSDCVKRLPAASDAEEKSKESFVGHMVQAQTICVGALRCRPPLHLLTANWGLPHNCHHYCALTHRMRIRDLFGDSHRHRKSSRIRAVALA